MTLKQLQSDMIMALKAGDSNRKAVISSLVDAIKKAGIDKNCRDNIPEDMVDAVILKEQKTIKEMIDTCPTDRKELLNEYTTRLNIVSEYAPRMMTQEEILDFLAPILQNDIKPIKANKGKIMKECAVLKGKVDMKMVAQIVDEMIKGE